MIKTTMQVDGMSCGMCESHINDVIRKTCRVKKVTSSHRSGITEVISEEELDEAAVRAAIAATGYTVTEFRSEPYSGKRRQRA